MSFILTNDCSRRPRFWPRIISQIHQTHGTIIVIHSAEIYSEIFFGFICHRMSVRFFPRVQRTKSCYDTHLTIRRYRPEIKLIVWVFQDEQNLPEVFRAISTSKQINACYFGKTGHVAALPSKQCKTVNYEFPSLSQFLSKKLEKPTA